MKKRGSQEMKKEDKKEENKNAQTLYHKENGGKKISSGVVKLPFLICDGHQRALVCSHRSKFHHAMLDNGTMHRVRVPSLTV
jgi:hypothetical protein